MTLNEFLNFQLGFLQWIEAGRQPFLDSIFLFFDILGKEPGYLIMAPLAYWLKGNRGGIKILGGFLICWFVNMFLKDIFNEPRPFVFGNLTPVNEASGPSFPSGHAQLSAFFWPALCASWPNKWLRIAGVIMILGVCTSRLYLGVHFPHDVLAGLLIGYALFILVFKFVPDKFWERRNYIVHIVIVLVMMVVARYHGIGKIAGLYLGLMLTQKPFEADFQNTSRLGGLLCAALFVELLMYSLISALIKQPAFDGNLYVNFVVFLPLGVWIGLAPRILKFAKPVTKI